MSNKVYVWGDSIAKGIVFDAQRGRYVGLRERSGFARAAQELHVEMENHAHFGMTTEKGKQTLSAGLQQAQAGRPALIGFGGNDVDYDWAAIARDPQGDHQPRVGKEQFADNLAQMVRCTRRAGLIPVLLTLPPIDAQRYFDWVTRGVESARSVLDWLGDVGRIYRAHREYSDLVRQVADTLGAHLIDVRSVCEAAGDARDRLCVDGIHPNAEGHAVIGRALTQYGVQYAL